jgi:hypothetical protein
MLKIITSNINQYIDSIIYHCSYPLTNSDICTNAGQKIENSIVYSHFQLLNNNELASSLSNFGQQALDEDIAPNSGYRSDRQFHIYSCLSCHPKSQ